MKTRPILGLAGILVAGALAQGCRSTDANEIAVNYCKFACVGGEVEVIEPSRFAFYVPVKHDWYTIDNRLQNLTMYLPERGKQQDPNQTSDPLIFKTKEGNDVKQGLTINWKINPAMAARIIEEVGTEIDDIAEKYVRPIVRSIIRDYLNELTSEEYYQGQGRFDKAAAAKVELSQRLEQFGIIVDTVNIVNYEFDGEYQAAINDAKLAGQEKEKNEREIGQLRENWAMEFEKAKGMANANIAEAEGYKKQKINEADNYFEGQKAKADATKSRMLAEAQGIVKMRQAMASRGGDTAVMMEYVKHFSPKEVVVLPCDDGGRGVSVNRLDLNQIIAAETARDAAEPAPKE